MSTARRLVALAPWLLVVSVAATIDGVGAWSEVEPEKGPGPRVEHGIAATNSGFVIWGGCPAERPGACREWLDTGSRFDPSGKGKWRATSTDGAPQGRDGMAVQGVGSDMVVWGGKEAGPEGHPGTGSVYDPQRDAWKTMSTVGAPAARVGFSSVWTGSRWFVWGGFHHVQVGTRVTGRYLADGGLYDPSADAWTALATEGAPSPRRGATAAWTGAQIVVWGGCAETATLCDPTGTGAVWTAATNRWSPMSAEGAPVLEQASADPVFTGGKLVVFGSRAVTEGSSRRDPTVWMWDAATDTWSWRDTPHPVQGRAFAIDERVLVIGADDAWTYNPANDGWTPISDAPTRHPGVAMALSGRRLLAWGGIWNEKTGVGPPQPHPVERGLLLELF